MSVNKNHEPVSFNTRRSPGKEVDIEIEQCQKAVVKFIPY